MIISSTGIHFLAHSSYLWNERKWVPFTILDNKIREKKDVNYTLISQMHDYNLYILTNSVILVSTCVSTPTEESTTSGCTTAKWVSTAIPNKYHSWKKMCRCYWQGSGGPLVITTTSASHNEEKGEGGSIALKDKKKQKRGMLIY